MKFRAAFLTLAVSFGAHFAFSAPALAGGPPKNLKVLEFNGKDFKSGMKLFTKGLGVKCKACHIKGKFDSDEMKSKVAGRDFLKATLAEKDQGKKDAALKALLAVLKIDAAKDPAKVWMGVAKFKAKK